MNKNYMNYDYLLKIENEKKMKTIEAYQPMESIFKNMINLLFAISYNLGELKDDKNQWLYNIQDLCQFFFMETAHNIRSIQILLEIGNYSLAGTTLRVILDSFVPYRYYTDKKNGEKFSDYTLQNSSTRIIDLYEKLSPGFYNDSYALLCGFAHGNPISLHGMRRISKSKGNTNTSYTTSDINMDWFSIIWNQLIHLFKGIIILFEDVFPDNSLKEEYYTKMKKFIINFIDSDIKYRLSNYKGHEEWINQYNNLIGDFK